MNRHWRNIDTSTPEGLIEIDCVIAGRTGWTFIRPNPHKPNGFTGQRPDVNYYLPEAIPDFTNDLNYAIQLRREGLHLDIQQRDAEGVWAVAYEDKNNFCRQNRSKHVNLATAICLAWLAAGDS